MKNFYTMITSVRVLGATTAGVLIFFQVLVLWWILFPYQPVELLNDPIPVLNENKQVRAGELVELDLNFKKKYDIRPEVEWFLVNGYVLKIADTNIKKDVGVNTSSSLKLIPSNSSKGTHHIEVYLKYKVNPIRSIEYKWVTEEFEVL